MKSEISAYIRDHGGTPWTAARYMVKSATQSDFVIKVAETFATRIALIGVGLITGILIARILGPEGRGLYAVAMTVSTTGIQFGNLGLHASNTYYVAKDRTLLPSLVGNSILVSVVFGFISAAVWAAFHAWPAIAPVHGFLLLLSLLWIPIGLAYLLMQNILLGIQEVRAYNTIELVMQVISVIVLTTVIVTNIVKVEIVFLVGLLTVLLSTIWTFSRIKKHLRVKLAISISLFQDNLKYGMKAYTAALLAFLVLRADLVMVKYMLGAEQAGYYSIAVALADTVYMLPVVVATILFPKLTSMNEKKQKWNFSKKAILSIGFILALLTGVTAAAAGPIIRILFGQAYEPAVPALIWLMPGIFFIGIQSVAVQFLNSEGFPPLIIVAWSLAFLVNIISNLIAIPAYGIKGASIASSISYFLLFAGIIVIIKRVLRENK